MSSDAAVAIGTDTVAFTPVKPKTTTSARRRVLVSACVPVYLVLIAGSALAIAVVPLLVSASMPARVIGALIAPATFTATYAIVAGLLSRVTLGAMQAGRFPRDLGHAVYGPRRLHALCWTAVYYFTPVYHAVLAIPALKRVVFRLFGYRGSLDVALYPDTWIRDLPVLELGEGAYISNRSTIGTNMCLTTGDVLVAPVRIGRRAMVGHLSMLAPGVVLGERVEVSVGAGIGLDTTIGARSRIGPCVVVHHGVTIGNSCDIGASSYIGLKAIIGDRLVIPPGSVIPARSVLRTQQDVDALTRGRSPVEQAPVPDAVDPSRNAHRPPPAALSVAFE